MSKRGKKRPGRAAGRTESSEMRALGYDTPARVAKAVGAAPTTVYGWAKTWHDAGHLTDGKPSVVHTTRGVWVLVAAAKAMRPDGKTLLRKTAA